ncbi:MAG: glycosyltransferase family 2 protein [Geobacter sp.]|nr:glycosyltransferase family 2 protein [Geobacter sp.]
MVNGENLKTLILIPAYNEGEGIARVIARVRQAVPDADILVVNDGSRDETAAAAASAGVIVVSHPFNMGYGVAIQTGYKYAFRHGYDFLAQIDADGQHDPECIPMLLAPVIAGETDFVIGSRFLEAGSYTPPLPRRIAMGFFRKLVSFLTGTAITDSTSGFQAFNREVIRYFTRDSFPCDYPDADMLITIHRAGFRIRELPARMFVSPSGRSMHSGWKPFYYMFKMMLSIFVTLLRRRER